MPSPLASFFLGGFECATHRRRDRRQIDVIHDSGHDVRAAVDYGLLQSVGIATVRDGLRWHLIEQQPGIYDWSSFLPMLQASIQTHTQVIWDLCHWGLPAGLDIFSDSFPARFADFAAAAVRVIGQHTTAIPLVCPINEISFWSWVGGDVEAFYPYQTQSGPALKQQLIRATLAATEAIRNVDPRTRFVQAEPIISIVADVRFPEHRIDAERHTASQYETWDALAARQPQSALDIVGVNFYWNNQWVHHGERVPLGHPQHRPLHSMLLEIWQRFGRPILITETGVESDGAAGWLGYISAEVRQAQILGVQILGICLYPVMDYPGWDDERHCHCGPIAIDPQWQQRTLRPGLTAELLNQQRIFASQ